MFQEINNKINIVSGIKHFICDVDTFVTFESGYVKLVAPNVSRRWTATEGFVSDGTAEAADSFYTTTLYNTYIANIDTYITDYYNSHLPVASPTPETGMNLDITQPVLLQDRLVQLPNDSTKTAIAYSWDVYPCSLKWKKDIQPILSPIQKLKQIDGIVYTHDRPGYQIDGKPGIGVAAEQIEALGFPECVRKQQFEVTTDGSGNEVLLPAEYDNQGNPIFEDGKTYREDYSSINLTPLTALLIETLKYKLQAERGIYTGNNQNNRIIYFKESVVDADLVLVREERQDVFYSRNIEEIIGGFIIKDKKKYNKRNKLYHYIALGI
ncbi:MAG: hypothetical protein GY861_22735 [bacterium]|nr:hypothetical protein [bacterium]